jgi:hypothetical protein
LAAFRAGLGIEERKMVLGIVFPYFLLLFSGGETLNNFQARFPETMGNEK